MYDKYHWINSEIYFCSKYIKSTNVNKIFSIEKHDVHLFWYSEKTPLRLLDFLKHKSHLYQFNQQLFVPV
jgi:aminopeptidase-like protein